MTDPHEVVRYQPDPERHAYTWRAYCAKHGCRWSWDGVGSFEHYRDEHETLNDEQQTFPWEQP